MTPEEEWKLQQKNSRKESAKKWRENNPGKIAAIKRNWRRNNPESARASDQRKKEKKELDLALGVQRGTKCLVVECAKLSVSHGLCDTHRKRRDRHGSVDSGRPLDWGTREKHPLYGTWTWLRRRHGSAMLPAWEKDFWQFVKDVEARPSERHMLARKASDGPWGPGNVFWREMLPSGDTEEGKEAHRKYMRDYYHANKDQWRDQQFRRYYGLTVEQYNERQKEQKNKCLICNKPEVEVDTKTGLVRRLSVDHCHNSQKVRGLLCSKCNTGVGSFKDDPELLRKAAAYIEAHRD